ncbi:accessory gene regulator B family protein [Roseburia faecis]|uniref:accessory gene regulator B family protein n=1 Tax=Roseburia faecis TaxID=301302 RepID=UPI003F97F3A6
MQKYAGTIITWLICQQAIQERDRELYTYALYNMVLLIIPLGLTVIFGEIIGNVKQGIVMILPFITLRKYSGGYHAKTPLRCMIISSLLLFLCIKIIFELSCNWKLLIVEYSCAITPQVRQAGNRLSGLTETAYASLLA